MVVDSDMDVLEATLARTVASDPCLGEARVEAFTATVGNASEFLNVEVDEFTGLATFVTDDRPRGLVHCPQDRKPFTPEDTVDRGTRHLQFPCEPVRPCSQFTAERTDSGDHLLTESAGQVFRPAAAVLQAGKPFVPVAPPPLGDGRTGEAESAGDLRLGEAVLEELHDGQPSGRSELGVRMGHEGLRRSWSTTATNGLALSQSMASWHGSEV